MLIEMVQRTTSSEIPTRLSGLGDAERTEIVGHLEISTADWCEETYPHSQLPGQPPALGVWSVAEV